MRAGGHNLYTIHLPYSSSLVSSRNELITLSGALNFVADARGHLYISWVWWPVGLTLVGSTGL